MEDEEVSQQGEINMKFAQKVLLTAVISLFMNAFASSDISSNISDLSAATPGFSNASDINRKIDELKSSFDKIAEVTIKATRELAKVGAESMQDSLKTANNSMLSLMTTVYNLIEPILKTQTVYRSVDGQSYVIPTSAISTREKFDMASFKNANAQKLKEKNASVTPTPTPSPK